VGKHAEGEGGWLLARCVGGKESVSVVLLTHLQSRNSLPFMEGDVKGCTRLNRIKIKDIQKELDIYLESRSVDKCRENSLTYLIRMDNKRLPKLALRYKPKE
jgi:hypothetical protein